MTKNEKIDQLSVGFKQLSDESKEYILAILQALVFAQNTGLKHPSHNDERVKIV